MTLHEAIAAGVTAWRLAGYQCEAFPAIAEVLEWAHGAKDSGNERFRRAPQLKALETYWYLRLVDAVKTDDDLVKKFKLEALRETLIFAPGKTPIESTDFIEGRYELEAPKGKTTVAVRITDMLGEEVVVTKVV